MRNIACISNILGLHNVRKCSDAGQNKSGMTGVLLDEGKGEARFVL
jgi:hypothetical protein